MSLEKPRIQRLYSIVTQLLSKKIVTATEISEKHDISIRTVYRDIRTLEASGIPLITIEGKGYSIVEGFKLPPANFSEDEILALHTVEKLIATTNDESLKLNFRNLAEKLKSNFSSSFKDDLDFIEDRINIRPNLKKGSANLIDIQKAILSKSKIKIEYKSRLNEITDRTIHPYAIFSTKGNWVCVAYCELRLNYRLFRLDNIIDLDIESEKFKPREFSLEKFFEDQRKKYFTPDIPLTYDRRNFELNKSSNYFNSNYKVFKSMKNVKINAKKYAGITKNIKSFDENFIQIIQAAWDEFSNNQIFEKISNKLGYDVVCIYEYIDNNPKNGCNLLIGTEVSSLEGISEELSKMEIPGGNYIQFISKGDITKGSVGETWNEIMQSNLDQNFTYDIEVYGKKAKNMQDAEVDIYISVN
jgi:predicted DNA-binding transcriptional regulator YafY/predicted transcriptional regulator YdeE